MRYVQIVWDDDENPRGNVQHIGEHGLTREDVEFVIENATSEALSASTGLPCLFGHTPGGDFIIVVFEIIDADTIYPVTAYEVLEPK